MQPKIDPKSEPTVEPKAERVDVKSEPKAERMDVNHEAPPTDAVHDSDSDALDAHSKAALKSMQSRNAGKAKKRPASAMIKTKPSAEEAEQPVKQEVPKKKSKLPCPRRMLMATLLL